MGRVQEKVAVVTGAGNGIGQAIALRLAEEGARLVCGDIDGAAIERTVSSVMHAGGTAIGVVGDLTLAEPADELIAAAVERFGRVDILVNNVGGGQPGRIWELPEATWDAVITLNLRAMFLCTRAAARPMMAQRYGRIVSISSGAREGTPWSAYYEGAAPYSTAKAGVHGFTRDIALELAEYGITANAVAPGPVETERLGPALHHMNEMYDYSPQRMTPLRRLAQPVEVAHAVLFLASDEAAYITGHTLHVTGGR
ncbi:MAG: SDR family oxidoreductase [Chloroflexi bacterium]|nr:SDR family oxidoreductase [Chloroflexota bacterium]